MLEASSSYDTDTLNNENDQNIEGVQNLINLKENNQTGQLPDIQMDDEDNERLCNAKCCHVTFTRSLKIYFYVLPQGWKNKKRGLTLTV